MTSMLPDEEEESNVTRLKQKSQTHAVQMGKLPSVVTDESRSFLRFSRENLSISTTELEQGFSRSWSTRRCNRPSLLSCAALLLALACAALELWKLRRVLGNARDIDIIRRDVETLKHRFLEKDLLDELKAFEEQLYSEGTSDEEEQSSNNLSGDYDSSYDDSSAGSGDYPVAVNNPATSETTTAATISGSSVTPCTSRELEDVLEVLRRAEAEKKQVFERGVERERMLQEERRRSSSSSSSTSPLGDLTARKTRASGKFYTRLKLTVKQ